MYCYRLYYNSSRNKSYLKKFIHNNIYKKWSAILIGIQANGELQTYKTIWILLHAILPNVVNNLTVINGINETAGTNKFLF